MHGLYNPAMLQPTRRPPISLRHEPMGRRPMPQRHTPSPLGIRMHASKQSSLCEIRSTDSRDPYCQTRTPSLTSVIGMYQSLSSSTSSQIDAGLRISPYYDYSEDFEFKQQTTSSASSPEQTPTMAAAGAPFESARSVRYEGLRQPSQNPLASPQEVTAVNQDQKISHHEQCDQSVERLPKLQDSRSRLTQENIQSGKTAKHGEV